MPRPSGPSAPALLAFSATAAILLGQAFRLSPLVDAADGSTLHDAALSYPAGYLLSAPFSAFADLLTFSSKRQAVAWVLSLLAAYWLRERRLAGYVVYLAALLAFLSWSFLYKRPMARLEAADPELAALDFHSHSSCSKDARRSFTPEENALWHAQAGFRAGFLTDHNGEACSRPRPGAPGYAGLVGEELSLHEAHVAALGPRTPIDTPRYAVGQEGLRAFLREAGPRYGAVPVLSLPEYWRGHWDELESLAVLSDGGLGLEIANGAPRALEFPPAARARVVDLARRRGFFLACATDDHGWSRAPYCWNLLRLPGHQAMAPAALEAAVLEVLRRGGPEAVTVASRRRVEASPGWRVALDPLLGLGLLTRTLSPTLAAACLAWIWALCGAWRSPPTTRP